MGWLEAVFLKVKETSQFLNLGARTSKCFWVPSHNHSSSSLPPETEQKGPLVMETEQEAQKAP